MKRLFLGIPVEPAEAILETQENMRDLFSGARVSWVVPKNLHFTLWFFGDVAEELLPRLMEAIDTPDLKMGAFTIMLSRPGCFYNGTVPSVIWIGIKPSEKLLLLKKQVDKLVTGLGFEPDPKAFKPHLTLGRMKSMERLRLSRDEISDQCYDLDEPVRIDHFHLYESVLHPSGPVYSVLKRVDLAKSFD